MRALLLLVLLLGCSSPPREHFYTLSAPEPAAADASAPALAVGPVSIPEMVDRPQLVVRIGPNEVQIVEQARWAEPLRNAVGRVVAANLAAALGARVAAARNGDVDYRVALDVQRFESPGDAVLIEALWTVTAKSGRRSGRSLVRQPITGKTYDVLVAAHSAALATLSREIAEAIRK